MKNITKQIYLLAGIACFGISSTAMATVTGGGSIGDCAGGGVIVNANSITWDPTGSMGAAFGCINFTATPGINYSGGSIANGDQGNLKDLVLSPPTGGDQFMTFCSSLTCSPSGNLSLDFVLTGFTAPVPDDGTNCGAVTSNNQSCVVVSGSPFLLTWDGTNATSVTLTANGTVVDGGVTSDWTLAFTTQVLESAATIQATINGGNTVPLQTYSASLSTASAVPEPGTATMLLFGGVALLGIGRLRFRKG
jgi:hypothetical protein